MIRSQSKKIVLKYRDALKPRNLNREVAREHCSGRSLVRPALENIKLVNYKDRVIMTFVLIETQPILGLCAVSTLDLKFYIYLA